MKPLLSNQNLFNIGLPQAKPKAPSEYDKITMPAVAFPSFRTTLALHKGTDKNILFKVHGGIGDQICTEPTIRYAFKYLPKCKISLCAEYPELFSHYKFDKVFNSKKQLDPDWFDYYILDTMTSQNTLVYQFIAHSMTHCVDFPALSALRITLPFNEREIQLSISEPKEDLLKYKNSVIIHAGKHWPSKTFPKDYWNAILDGIHKCGITPVLIGATISDKLGTVDVDATHCVDLRNKTSLEETIWLCKNANIVLTNDSAPIHMAASGDAWIGYFATCKHPDYITHWRKGQFGYKQENLSVGGLWTAFNFRPQQKEMRIDEATESQVRSWLPEPQIVIDWIKEKYHAMEI